MKLYPYSTNTESDDKDEPLPVQVPPEMTKGNAKRNHIPTSTSRQQNQKRDSIRTSTSSDNKMEYKAKLYP